MLKLLWTLSFFTKVKCVTNSWVWVLLRIVGTGLVKGNCFVSSKHLEKYIYFEICNWLGCFCNTWESFFFYIDLQTSWVFWNTWERFFLIEIGKACGPWVFSPWRGGLGEWQWGLLAAYTVRLEFDLPAHHILVVVLLMHNGNFQSLEINK